MQAPLSTARRSAGILFQEALARFETERGILILSHFDADGLASAAILARAFERVRIQAEIRLVGKGENAWDAAIGREVAEKKPGGLIVADLGVREGDIVAGISTLIIDHHVPGGAPGQALVISGHGLSPEPSTALLAFWCAETLGPAEDLLWLAAMGLIGDMADGGGFDELERAQVRYGKTALRSAVALVNAPRRSSSADAGPALALLLKCESPKELLSGTHRETVLLIAAREEVRRETEAARRAAPKVRGEVALIRFSSPCQVHPLVAQQWRGRLRDKIVIAANTGYRPGWVHFAARTATDRDLVAFLRERRPSGAGEGYGSGHRQATGGALLLPAWNEFVRTIGVPEEQVEA